MFTRKKDEDFNTGKPFSPLRGVLTLCFGLPGVVLVMLGATILAIKDRAEFELKGEDDHGKDSI